MDTTMFLPKEIKVGFQERGSTYTGKLAYVIYIDEKGKVRKEKSFESWRNSDIPTEQFENEPTSGFVLNKKAGGYSTGWNHRQTYVRVYDPRGFEFEISIENLLYILDNTSSIIGKGLEGEFVYAWSGTELVLLPVSAPEYEEIKKLNDLRHKKDFVKAKDLKVGASYRTKDNEHYVYLGKFDEYSHQYRTYEVTKKDKKQFYFAKLYDNAKDFHLITFPAVTRRLIDVIDENSHPEMNTFFEKLESKLFYCPIDHTKTVRKAMDLNTFLQRVEKRSWGGFAGENGKEYEVKINRYLNNKITFVGEYVEESYPSYFGESRTRRVSVDNMYNGELHEVETFEDVFNILKPVVTYLYQENGKFYEKVDYGWNM